MQTVNNHKTSIDSDGNLINIDLAEKAICDKEKAGLKGPVHKVMEQHFNTFEKDEKVYINGAVIEYSRENNSLQVYRENGSKEYTDVTSSQKKYRSFFNEKGLEYKDHVYTENNVLKSSSTKTYNDKNQLIETIDYNAEMVVQSGHTRTYDDYGNLTGYSEYDKDHQITFITTYVFENGKEEIEHKRTDGAGLITHWSKQKNNSKGHCIEKTELAADGNILKVTSYAEFYDSEGNSLHNRFDNQYEKEIYTVTTEEDHHGNWVVKNHSYNGLTVKILFRYILYFGEEAPKDFYNQEVTFDVLKPLLAMPIDAKKEVEEESIFPEFNAENTQWLADRTFTADQFSITSYYTLKNNEFPSLVQYNACNIDAVQLLEELKEGMNAKNIHESRGRYGDWRPYLSRYTLIFPNNPGYIIYASQINSKNGAGYHIPEFITDNYERYDESVYFSPILLLQPSEYSGNRNKELEEEIKSYINKCTLELIPEKPEIYMVEVANGNFNLQSHPIKDDFEITDLDVSYGHGFSTFHQELMNRFRRENKGLVLFHGLPGTGKTFYIRHLLREMALSNKKVIYMPPNMVDHLVEPAFMTFLTQTVNGYSAQGYFCVLLIEDAEPLLITRATENRIQGITNLLNMTDGILNDMLKLQIICTFNVELKQLDPALLRPGRLIARKEFKALPELDANILAQRLGIKFRFRKPTTLSEIYAKLKDKGTIIHEDY